MSIKTLKAVERAAMRWYLGWTYPPHHISQRRDYKLYQACANHAKGKR